MEARVLAKTRRELVADRRAPRRGSRMSFVPRYMTMPMPNPAEHPGSFDLRDVAEHRLERHARAGVPRCGPPRASGCGSSPRGSPRSCDLPVDPRKLVRRVARLLDHRQQPADVAARSSSRRRARRTRGRTVPFFPIGKSGTGTCPLPPREGVREAPGAGEGARDQDDRRDAPHHCLGRAPAASVRAPKPGRRPLRRMTTPSSGPAVVPRPLAHGARRRSR